MIAKHVAVVVDVVVVEDGAVDVETVAQGRFDGDGRFAAEVVVSAAPGAVGGVAEDMMLGGDAGFFVVVVVLAAAAVVVTVGVGVA